MIRPDIITLDEMIERLDREADKRLLRELIEKGEIPTIVSKGVILVDAMETVKILIREKKPTRRITGEHKMPEFHTYNNDLAYLLRRGTPEELLTFGKCVFVKEIDGHEFNLDFITSTQARETIIEELESAFIRIGSNLFTRGSRLKKPYRDILYLCARKIRGIPFYRDADKFDSIKKPYPREAVEAGINDRRMVHVSAISTEHMENAIVEILFHRIWEKMNHIQRKDFLEASISEVADVWHFSEYETQTLKTILTEAIRHGLNSGKILPFFPNLLVTMGIPYRVVGNFFAATAAIIFTQAIGITAPVSAFSILGPAFGILVSSFPIDEITENKEDPVWKPNYRRLYPAICILTQIRSRPSFKLRRASGP